MPPTRPLLVFPSFHTREKAKKSGGGQKLHLPTGERQVERLAPRFEELQRAFDARRVELAADPAQTPIEQVLVLETAGSVDRFLEATRRVPELRWLAELELEESLPDEDFFVEARPDKPVTGRLFLIMTNQRALEELLSLWHRFQQDPTAPFDRGLAPLRQAFLHLRDIRRWDVKDRLHETGLLEDWRQRVTTGQDLFPFEIELWFKEDRQGREQSQQVTETLVREEKGEIVGSAQIPEIRYHAVLARLPLASAQVILEQKATRLLRCEQVMQFRPTGQVSVAVPTGALTETREEPEWPPPTEEAPIVAMLDGMPLATHQLLAGRLRLDDPDGFAAGYQATEFRHGTFMASLIARGELDANEVPLDRPVYVRPVMTPDPRDFSSPRTEAIPEDKLAVDLIYRAVRRMFDADGDQPAAAATVRVINISVCDRGRPFLNIISPMARLLDWLSWQYGVLFIVSAGNCEDSFDLSSAPSVVDAMSPEELRAVVLQALAATGRHRRLLSPAEAINAVTVGAAHADRSPAQLTVDRRDPFSAEELPSPASRLGLGHQRAVKPDLLVPGGRLPYRALPAGQGTRLTPVRDLRPPGQATAAPGVSPADLTRVVYVRGTSNAAALATRAAAQLHDVATTLLSGEPSSPAAATNERERITLVKALLVHGADWGNAYRLIDQVLSPPRKGQNQVDKDYFARFLGYGALRPGWSATCTDLRATIVACGMIRNGEGHVYEVPLPGSLSATTLWRRFTLTLAWLTPINPRVRAYRVAELWAQIDEAALRVARAEASCQWQTVLRGTVQHEVFEGQEPLGFPVGASMEVCVNCRAATGIALDEQVPYGLVVTLEVAEGTAIPLYEEVRQALRIQVPVQPRA
jgi:hypothetical protein